MFDVCPKHKVVAVALRYVPFYHIFRYDKKWWWHLPPMDTGSEENAYSIEKDDSEEESMMLSLNLDQVVGLHIDDLPKSLSQHGTLLY